VVPRNLTMCSMGSKSPKRKGAISGLVRPPEKHYESLLRCTLQKSLAAPQRHCCNGQCNVTPKCRIRSLVLFINTLTLPVKNCSLLLLLSLCQISIFFHISFGQLSVHKLFTSCTRRCLVLCDCD